MGGYRKGRDFASLLLATPQIKSSHIYGHRCCYQARSDNCHVYIHTFWKFRYFLNISRSQQVCFVLSLDDTEKWQKRDDCDEKYNTLYYCSSLKS